MSKVRKKILDWLVDIYSFFSKISLFPFHGTLKHVNHILKENNSLREEINQTLEKEGLRYDGAVEVRHVLEVFYKDIGIDKLKENKVRTFDGLQIATHYGCHILRPRQIV